MKWIIEKKIISDFGHIVQRRGNIMNVLIKIEPDKNREENGNARIAFNTDTGRITRRCPKVSWRLLNASIFHLWFLTGCSYQPRVRVRPVLVEIEKVKSDVANAIRTIDFFTEKIGVFAGEAGADGMMNGLEKTLFQSRK